MRFSQVLVGIESRSSENDKPVLHSELPEKAEAACIGKVMHSARWFSRAPISGS